MKTRAVVASVLGVLGIVSGAAAQLPANLAAPPPPKYPLLVDYDLTYTEVGARNLHLDLYRRETPDGQPLPVVIWVHDSGDAASAKYPTPAVQLVADGYAVASIEYRLPGESAFPASLFDAKAAVRWLRANADKYHLDGHHIGALGNSADGEIVSLLATTGTTKSLDGDEGALDQSSAVQAVAVFFGSRDLIRTGSSLPTGAGSLDGTSNAEKVRTADPITYIAADNPPFLIVQGTADTMANPRQSEFLQRALNAVGVENDLEYVFGASHTFTLFETPLFSETVAAFFDKYLRSDHHQRDDISTIAEPPDTWLDPFATVAPGAYYAPGTQWKLYATPTRGHDTQASYRVYKPPGYDAPANARQRYPVIYFLHGFNDDSRMAESSGYISRLDVAIRTGVMPPVIVIAVQAPSHNWYVDSADGKSPVESVIIKDLIPAIDRTYRTISRREARAIEGHSMGGAGALHLGFKFPELFSVVSALSPALIPPEAFNSGTNVQMLNSVFGGDIERYNFEGGWSWAERNSTKIRGRTRVRLVTGDRDGLFPRTRWMAEILTKLDISHQFLASKGSPHALKQVLAHLDANPFAFYGEAFAAFQPAHSVVTLGPKAAAEPQNASKSK